MEHTAAREERAGGGLLHVEVGVDGGELGTQSFSRCSCAAGVPVELFVAWSEEFVLHCRSLPGSRDDPCDGATGVSQGIGQLVDVGHDAAGVVVFVDEEGDEVDNDERGASRVE